MKWWKAHHGISNDTKLALVAYRAKARRCEVGWVWITLLDFCSQNDRRGNITGIEIDQIALSCEIDEDVVSRIMEALQTKGLILSDGTIAAWHKRNSGTFDKTNKERQRRYREKGKNTPVDRQDDNNALHRPNNALHQPNNALHRPNNALRVTKRRGEEKRKDLPLEIVKTTATANAREISRLAAAEFPKTTALLARKFPTIDSAMVTKIIHASAQAWCSVENPQIPEPGDEVFAAAIEAAKNGKQTSAALFLRTVPTVISNWARSGRPQTASAVDPNKISPYDPLKFKKESREK
jgi:hypothetical protein